MKTYIVAVKEIHYAYYNVDAKNPAEAKIFLNEALADGINLGELKYSHTANMDEWIVKEKE